jgi:hypothetical protein
MYSRGSISASPTLTFAAGRSDYASCVMRAVTVTVYRTLLLAVLEAYLRSSVILALVLLLVTAEACVRAAVASSSTSD